MIAFTSTAQQNSYTKTMNTKHPLLLRTILSITTILTVLIVDQWSKFIVKTTMLLHEKIEITDWFYICFIENRGMAFGMDFIGTLFLSIFRIVAVGFFCWLLVRIIQKKLSFGLIFCFSLILSGAAGNIIDNCLYGMIFEESPTYGWFCDAPAKLVSWGEGYGSFLSGKVVDMFYFPLFTWPDWVPLLGGQIFFNAIFNVADAAISCGAVALLLFHHRYLNSQLFSKSQPNQDTPSPSTHPKQDEA